MVFWGIIIHFEVQRLDGRAVNGLALFTEEDELVWRELQLDDRLGLGKLLQRCRHFDLD